MAQNFSNFFDLFLLLSLGIVVPGIVTYLEQNESTSNRPKNGRRNVFYEIGFRVSEKHPKVYAVLYIVVLVYAAFRFLVSDFWGPR